MIVTSKPRFRLFTIKKDILRLCNTPPIDHIKKVENNI